MISTLRSIDNVLYQFDQLSKSHTNLLVTFDKNFADIKNPLRNVERTEPEQRKSRENILLDIDEEDKKFESIQSLEDFHRHIIKTQHPYRPPTYSFNRLPSKKDLISQLTSFTSKTVNRRTVPKRYNQKSVNKQTSKCPPPLPTINFRRQK